MVGLPHRPGVLLARTVTRIVRRCGCLSKRQLQAFQPVAKRSGVRSKVFVSSCDQAGQSSDQASGFVEISIFTGFGIGGAEADLFGCGAHQHHRRTCDHFDGGYFGEFAHLVGRSW